MSKNSQSFIWLLKRILIMKMKGKKEMKYIHN